MSIKVSVIIPVYNQEKLVIRALESIPKRDDIEIIVIDDKSIDNTWDNILNYCKENPTYNIITVIQSENRGVADTVNTGYDLATGEYVVLLGSDDYFYTENFLKILDKLDGTDLVYFNLIINNGDIWRLTPETKTGYCGSVKFMRRDFIGDTRNPKNKRAREDFYFYKDLLRKNPTEIFTDINVKHYNYPRNGSLTDLVKKGRL